MGEWDVRYLGSRMRAHATKTFTFERPPDLDYQPGQFFFIMLPEGPSGGPIEHHFTFSSSPTEPTVEFTTRLTGSEFKNWMDSLPEGDMVHIAGPDGAFVLQPDSKSVCYVCGGIGITPARSTVRWALDTGADLDIVVLYGNRDLGSAPFHEEFDAITSEHIRVVNVLSEPGPDWDGEVGLIDAQLVRRALPDYGSRDFYVAGSAPFVDGVTRMLMEELAVPAHHVFSEHFPGYAALAAG